MDTLDEVKDFWKKSTPPANTALSKHDVETIIRSRINKVNKSIAGYFWLSLSYQIFIYSFACHLLVKFHGDALIVTLSAAGALLYIPFTILLMRKFKKMFASAAGRTEDIRAGVRHRYELLAQFFRFKKRFDMVGIPLSCLIMVAILFTLYVPGGIEAHVQAGILAYAGMLLISAVTTWFENKKHFKQPLRRFEWIMADMEKND